jgi:hypothetical protein
VVKGKKCNLIYSTEIERAKWHRARLSAIMKQQQHQQPGVCQWYSINNLFKSICFISIYILIFDSRPSGFQSTLTTSNVFSNYSSTVLLPPLLLLNHAMMIPRRSSSVNCVELSLSQPFPAEQEMGTKTHTDGRTRGALKKVHDWLYPLPVAL